MEFVIIWIICGGISAVVASNKGRGGCGWFVIGVLLGPFGIILSLVVKADKNAMESKSLQAGESRKCPFCAELIRQEAVKCKHCGSMLMSAGDNSNDNSDYYFTLKCYECNHENKIGPKTAITFPICQGCGHDMIDMENRKHKKQVLDYIIKHKSSIDSAAHSKLVNLLN